MKRTLETKPRLIQISAAWNSREGAPLGRNQYVELEIKKPKANGASAKLSPVQKPCDKMAEAIVMDGDKRGQVVRVAAAFAHTLIRRTRQNPLHARKIRRQLLAARMLGPLLGPTRLVIQDAFWLKWSADGRSFFFVRNNLTELQNGLAGS